MRLSASLLFILALRSAAAADEYTSGRDKWLQGEYRAAYDTLLVARRLPDGRRLEVDYMIATSACRLGCCREWGFTLLGALPASYPVSADSRKIILEEQEQCRADSAGTPVTVDRLDRLVAAGVSGRAKVYYTPDETVGVSTYAARRLRTIPASELEARLARLEEKEKARQTALTLMRRSLRGRPLVAKAYSRFVVASASGHTLKQLDRISSTLDTFLAFADKEYDLARPDHFMTIYLVPEQGMVEMLANDLHGIGTARGTIGYAFRDDLSIVANVPGEAVGTVLHELMHLGVRRNFGDIPQWLDEGLASLYEVSTVCADRAYGEPNWRGHLLQEFWTERPALDELLRHEWLTIDSPDEHSSGDYILSPEVKRRVAEMAMARYFALFLERRGYLRQVYLAVRDRDFGSGQPSAKAASIALERVAGVSLTALDAQFVKWFNAGVPRTKHEGCPAGGR